MNTPLLSVVVVEQESAAKPEVSELCQRPKSRQAGFTLIEMLVVLVIIGLIMSLVGPRVLGYLSDSRVKAARLQIASLENSLDLFHMDASRYPTSQEGLGALLKRPAGVGSWNGPYLKSNSVPNDPWGHAYVFRSPGTHGYYDLLSLGSDGRDGGEGAAADVTNWQH
jgi:general secretion pathway protein G